MAVRRISELHLRPVGLSVAAAAIIAAVGVSCGRTQPSTGASAAVNPQDKSDGEENKRGYIDQEGKIIVPLRFEQAGRFSEELAPVRTDEGWGYIDKTGRFVIKPQYEPHMNGYAGPMRFSEGLAAIGTCEDAAVSSCCGFGYIDKTGAWVLKPVFESALPFSEGLAAVRKEGLYGYVDQTGPFKIPPRFDYAWEFNGGIARVLVDDKLGYIARSGTFLVEPQFDYATDFKDGVAVVNKDAIGTWYRGFFDPDSFTGTWGMIDRHGMAFIATNAAFVGGFSEGLAAIKRDSRVGEMLLAILVSRPAHWLHNVGIGNDWRIESFVNQRFPPRNDFIDAEGKIVISLKSIQAACPFSEGLAAVRVGDRWGYIDKKGSLKIPPKYTSVGAFHGGAAPVAMGTHTFHGCQDALEF